MYAYFNITMKFTLTRPYVIKKDKEPPEKQTWKKHYNIFLQTLYLDAALFWKSITIWEAKS